MTKMEMKKDIEAIFKEIVGVKPAHNEIVLLEEGDGFNAPVGHIDHASWRFASITRFHETEYTVDFKKKTCEYELTMILPKRSTYIVLGTCPASVVRG